jgi:hypothetical protein
LEAEEEAELNLSASQRTIKPAQRLGEKGACEIKFLIDSLKCASLTGRNDGGAAFEGCLWDAADEYAECIGKPGPS